MRILFVGGNSGGHLFPLVAVWRAVTSADSSARAHFVCSLRPDDRSMLEPEGCPITAIETPRIGLGIFRALQRDVRIAARVIDACKPDIVFSKGGAVSVPVCWAAHRRNIPIVLHESDAVMGRANRMISRWADAVCLGFSPFPSPSPIGGRVKGWGKGRTKRWEKTGNPIRPEVTHGSRAEGLRMTGFSGARPILLVIGGSQGAATLNEWVRRNLDELLRLCDVIHVTGTGKTGAAERGGYRTLPFAAEELPHLYAIADLAISRAGAGSIAELAANTIPALLVPLPGLAQDHQTMNALEAEKSGGCLCIPQSAVDATLLTRVQTIIGDAAKREAMSEAIASLHHPNAANNIAALLRQYAIKR